MNKQNETATEQTETTTFQKVLNHPATLVAAGAVAGVVVAELAGAAARNGYLGEAAAGAAYSRSVRNASTAAHCGKLSPAQLAERTAKALGPKASAFGALLPAGTAAPATATAPKTAEAEMASAMKELVGAIGAAMKHDLERANAPAPAEV